MNDILLTLKAYAPVRLEYAWGTVTGAGGYDSRLHIRCMELGYRGSCHHDDHRLHQRHNRSIPQSRFNSQQPARVPGYLEENHDLDASVLGTLPR